MSESAEERGFHLTEAERRYKELFGGPAFSEGPARRAYTPGVRIADAEGADAKRQIFRAARERLEGEDEGSLD